MICILHGWLLEGSGSNLWTRSIVTALAKRGETVLLVCQENHPDRYDAIAEAYRHTLSGETIRIIDRPTPFPGKCILHQPEIGETLPVFVKDKYEQYDRVVPMIELPDEEIELYITRNVAAVLKIVNSYDITAIHANHAVLMPVVAQRVSKEMGIPYTVMPHGSDIEYAVKRDERFRRYAASALSDARCIFVIGDEMRARVLTTFPEVPQLEAKFIDLHLGVDSSQFEPIPRESRAANIALLAKSIESTPRGKTAAQSVELRELTNRPLDSDELKQIITDNARYDGKSPDADVEEKLGSLDWARDPVLLFTGRVIAAKGVHCVIAAMPLILERLPNLRLVIVGHGQLREPMEVFINALATGNRDLVHEIVARGRWLEGAIDGEDSRDDLTELTDFFGELARRGDSDRYFETARRLFKPSTVIFTGYLTHRELRFLFPCCDVGVFPSIVREAGPLVFLEALASGCFPLGTYFGGMAASIDAVTADLPDAVALAMKLSRDKTTFDIADRVPRAFDLAPEYGKPLARIARDRYDWTNVAKTFRAQLY